MYLLICCIKSQVYGQLETDAGLALIFRAIEILITLIFTIETGVNFATNSRENIFGSLW